MWLECTYEVEENQKTVVSEAKDECILRMTGWPVIWRAI